MPTNTDKPCSGRQQQLAEIIEAIPGPDEVPVSAADLAQRLSVDFGEKITAEHVEVVFSFLRLFDAIAVLGEVGGKLRIRCSPGAAQYFLRSLGCYLRDGNPILSNWERSLGHTRSLRHEQITSGPQFLMALEQWRFWYLPSAVPIQEIRVVRAIIKANVGWKSGVRYLVQFDSETGKYKMIGGRLRSTDADSPTALMHEISEELREQPLRHGDDYHLQQIGDEIAVSRISSTYGALTLYRISFFQCLLHLDSLLLGPPDLWVTKGELMKGSTDSGNSIDNQGINELEKQLAGGLAGLPLSIATRQNFPLRGYLDKWRPELLMLVLSVLSLLATLLSIVL